MVHIQSIVPTLPRARDRAATVVAALGIMAGVAAGSVPMQAMGVDVDGRCQNSTQLAFGGKFGEQGCADCRREDGWSVRANLTRVWSGAPQFCFAPGTVITPELMARYGTLRGSAGGVGPNYYLDNSWSIAFYRGVDVQWSLVPDGTPMEEGYTSSLFAMMDSKFGGNRELWVGYIQSVFAEISRVSGIRFQQVSDNGSAWPNARSWGSPFGDIRIAAAPIDGHNTVLAFAYSPQVNGDLKLDIAENWENFTNSYRFFRNVFAHELCHAVGLDHSCPGNHTKLMEPVINLNFDLLTHDEILGLQALYGDAQEPDNSAGQAKVFQSQQSTTLEFFTYGAAADSATASVIPGDQDWTRSSLAASMPVTFTVTPKGRSYDTSREGPGGCGSGNVVNSLAQTGLRIQIRDAAGNILAAAQGAPGQSVTVSAQVPQGEYYSVVQPVSSSFAMPQLYTLTRTIGAPQPPQNDPWFEGILLGQIPYGMDISGTTVGATTDGMASFQPGGVLGVQDVYYNFSPWDGPGRFRIAVTGGNLVSVHRATGVPSPLNQWLPLDQNNNNGFGVLEVNITDPGACIIRVAVPNGGTPGSHTVSVRYMDGPANDSCQTPVDVTSGTYSGTTIFARPEPTPYPTSCTTDSFTLPWGAWYRFVAPSEGVLSLDVCNTFQNTIIGVYAGCPNSGGELVACNDDVPQCANGGSALSLPVVGGQEYMIRVSHVQNLSGNFQLNVGFSRDGDTCETASAISAGETPFSNVGYTTDNSTCSSGATRWYRYTATGYSTVNVFTCDTTSYDSTIAVWDSCPTSGGALITCNDDACSVQSAVSFQSRPGQQFLLAVGGYNGATGSGTIQISESPSLGEICAFPIVVTEGNVPFSTIGHDTNGPAEPNCNFCCNDPQIHGELWYAYLATGTGTLTVSSCDANYDSKMAAYASCPTGDGQAIACADDECGVQARLVFPVVQGENYLIRVGGYGGWTGSGNLNISLAPACAADFNQDGTVDFFDYLDFVAAFSSADPLADFNLDQTIDFFDYLDFVAAFSMGC